MPGGRRSCPPLGSFHLVLGPWLRGWGGESRVRGTGAAERAWPVVRAREPLYSHRWAFLSIPAHRPSPDPPGHLGNPAGRDSLRLPRKAEPRGLFPGLDSGAGGRWCPRSSLSCAPPEASGGALPAHQLAPHRVAGKAELPVDAEHPLGGLALWPRRGWADPPASPGSVRVWFLRWEVVGRRSSQANSRPPGDPPTPRERERGPALSPTARSPGRSQPGPQARAGRGLPVRAVVPRTFAFSAAGKRVSHDSPRRRQPGPSLGGSRVQGQLPVQAALLTKPIGVGDSEDPAYRRFTQPREDKTRAPPQEGDVPLLGQVGLAQPLR
ncbi:unnamed protein product [Rangifer tarandus platyrhynchus]|uniref:Uncharacterized protein n=2 Tax=Rangifer tarandus platyrhynchus TaxID=3082113 RepID=A0ACB0DY32_RANTA|nr:unnamed protein product [Rangifer tarandus platyrhynchus]CAI9693069.1 unnamed protein product [Rangifer tarandus platyrhynchus]